MRRLGFFVLVLVVAAVSPFGAGGRSSFTIQKIAAAPKASTPKAASAQGVTVTLTAEQAVALRAEAKPRLAMRPGLDPATGVPIGGWPTDDVLVQSLVDRALQPKVDEARKAAQLSLEARIKALTPAECADAARVLKTTVDQLPCGAGGGQ
jgi:hypothetical protein